MLKFITLPAVVVFTGIAMIQTDYIIACIAAVTAVAVAARMNLLPPLYQGIHLRLIVWGPIRTMRRRVCSTWYLADRAVRRRYGDRLIEPLDCDGLTASERTKLFEEFQDDFDAHERRILDYD